MSTKQDLPVELWEEVFEDPKEEEEYLRVALLYENYLSKLYYRQQTPGLVLMLRQHFGHGGVTNHDIEHLIEQSRGPRTNEFRLRLNRFLNEHGFRPTFEASVRNLGRYVKEHWISLLFAVVMVTAVFSLLSIAARENEQLGAAMQTGFVLLVFGAALAAYFLPVKYLEEWVLRISNTEKLVRAELGRYFAGDDQRVARFINENRSNPSVLLDFINEFLPERLRRNIAEAAKEVQILELRNDRARRRLTQLPSVPDLPEHVRVQLAAECETFLDQNTRKIAEWQEHAERQHRFIAVLQDRSGRLKQSLEAQRFITETMGELEEGRKHLGASEKRMTMQQEGLRSLLEEIQHLIVTTKFRSRLELGHSTSEADVSVDEFENMFKG